MLLPQSNHQLARLCDSKTFCERYQNLRSLIRFWWRPSFSLSLRYPNFFWLIFSSRIRRSLWRWSIMDLFFFGNKTFRPQGRLIKRNPSYRSLIAVSKRSALLLYSRKKRRTNQNLFYDILERRLIIRNCSLCDVSLVWKASARRVRYHPVNSSVLDAAVSCSSRVSMSRRNWKNDWQLTGDSAPSLSPLPRGLATLAIT